MASTQKWTIEFEPAAQRELDKLDKPVARRILKFLYRRIGKLDNPQQIGEKLQGTLSEFWNTVSETTASSVPWSMLGWWCSCCASVTAGRSILVEELFPPRHRRHLILAQLATDAALRPQPVSKYLPASRTLPLREPPPTGQVHSDPG